MLITWVRTGQWRKAANSGVLRVWELPAPPEPEGRKGRKGKGKGGGFQRKVSLGL